jgi:outer membrane protein OmpA-like peptidoglycan-associated protein
VKPQAMMRAVLGLSLVLPGVRAHADVEAAKRFYEQAKAEKSPEAQAGLLEKSIAAEPTFEAYLALADVQLGTQAYAKARENLKKALELAATEKARARALYLTAETFLGEARRREAVTLFRESIREHPYPNVIARLKEVELKAMDAPVGADEIAGALTSRSTRGFYVAPASIDLRIGFAFDSAELDGKGLAQARELGRALSDAALAEQTFAIVGHTDRKGDDTYNDRLSRRRAEAVRDLLTKEFKLAAGRLVAEGKGKRELLYPGDSDSDDALNRRVEVRVR